MENSKSEQFCPNALSANATVEPLATPDRAEVVPGKPYCGNGVSASSKQKLTATSDRTVSQHNPSLSMTKYKTPAKHRSSLRIQELSVASDKDARVPNTSPGLSITLIFSAKEFQEFQERALDITVISDASNYGIGAVNRVTGTPYWKAYKKNAQTLRDLLLAFLPSHALSSSRFAPS
ncbi:hypothetical protein T265_04493 [Opisthorchis viverrini]|uniref:Uncharacterized protein n=1 Tax=Opisthorchis viverrini TaxID=6198 RepID=A0A074ZMV5_OPIVI|nr:hypothetical protein T265_04493 [Opisthorchis viverrini]KER28703.1 hypothetical protein T265_04493 [Opisthorchis viverrini]